MARARNERDGIPCRDCGCRQSAVVDSRATISLGVRRRRKCDQCGRRYTTYEREGVDYEDEAGTSVLGLTPEAASALRRLLDAVLPYDAHLSAIRRALGQPEKDAP